MPRTATVAYAVASLENRARRSGLRFSLIAFRKPSRSSPFRRTRQASPCPPPRSRSTATQRPRQRVWLTQLSGYPVMVHIRLERRLQPTRSASFRSSHRAGHQVPKRPHRVGPDDGTASPNCRRQPSGRGSASHTSKDRKRLNRTVLRNCTRAGMSTAPHSSNTNHRRQVENSP